MPKHRTPPTKKPKPKDETNLFSVPVTPLYKLNRGSKTPTQKNMNPYWDERGQEKRKRSHKKPGSPMLGSSPPENAWGTPYAAPKKKKK